MRAVGGRLLPDNKYNRYSLQLNVYAHILATRYGERVSAMYLVRITSDIDRFELERVQPMPSAVATVRLMRRRQLEAIAKIAKIGRVVLATLRLQRLARRRRELAEVPKNGCRELGPEKEQPEAKKKQRV